MLAEAPVEAASVDTGAGSVVGAGLGRSSEVTQRADWTDRWAGAGLDDLGGDGGFGGLVGVLTAVGLTFGGLAPVAA